MPQNLDINRIVEKVLDQIAREARSQGSTRRQTRHPSSDLPPNKYATTRTSTVNSTATNKLHVAAAASIATNQHQITTHGCKGGDEELFVTDRVIALGQIEKRLAGKKRLAIIPGAVLTPSVRDYLREKRISICTTMPKGSVSEHQPVSIIAGLTSYNPTELVNRLTQERFDVTASSSSCLIETTDRLAEQLTDTNRLGVVLTTHLAVTLCLANRHATLRAISVDCENEVERLTSTVGANLLILSPRGRSCFQLQRMITRFLQMPSHDCPDVLKSRLA